MSGNFRLSTSDIGIKAEAGALKVFYSPRRHERLAWTHEVEQCMEQLPRARSFILRVFVVNFLADLIVVDKKLRCLLKIPAGLPAHQGVINEYS
jgi:hypothetical protein